MPPQLHCGENLLKAQFSGSAEADVIGLAMAFAGAKIAKGLQDTDNDLTNTDLCPDRCIHKEPVPAYATWKCTKFTIRLTKNGKWRVAYAFNGEVKVTCS